MPRPRKSTEPGQLSEKQAAVFNYIKECVTERNYPPSVRDICQAVGLKSTSSAFAYINDLERMGLLRKDPLHPRAIQILSDDFAAVRRDISQIPLVGEIAAGQPILAEENITDYYPLPTDMLPNKTVFMLKVKGESMVNAGILDGDKVIVAQQNTAENGEIVVALIDDSATVKRFYKEKDHIRLQPENDAMEPIIVDSCMILGKVIGLVRLGMSLSY